MRPGKRRRLNPFIEPQFLAERVEKMKASIRAKVEYPFRVHAPHHRAMAESTGPETRMQDVVEAVWRAATDASTPMYLPAGADTLQWAAEAS